MRWQEYPTYRCPCCGYVVADNKIIKWITNCPQCGENVEKENNDDIGK